MNEVEILGRKYRLIPDDKFKVGDIVCIDVPVENHKSRYNGKIGVIEYVCELWDGGIDVKLEGNKDYPFNGIYIQFFYDQIRHISESKMEDYV